ncbi:MAG: universal stress protein [Anaerolineales bacterium]
MQPNTSHNHEAVSDFRSARQRAALEELLARVTGRSSRLLSYDEVAQKLHLQARSERGIQMIPLDAIVGSVGRYTDFTRSFLPRNANDEQRWASVKASLTDPANPGWPPIDVYKVGEVYFVLDGNHRVSIARQEGWESIEAHIIEVQTSVPLTADMQPDDLIIQAEYAEFLAETGLQELRPGLDLSVTAPGQYARLREHIQVHQYFMGLDFQRDVDFPEAVTHWYDTVYLTIVEPLREGGFLRWFPGRTATDLYLWVSEHRAALEKELGWEIRPESAAATLSPEKALDAAPGTWRQARLLDRYTDHLFEDILVPISGEPGGWQALDQALILARREAAKIHGLHVVDSAEKAAQPEALAVQARFAQICASAGVTGTLVIEVGDPARKIVERSLLVDLVALKVLYPPSGGVGGLTSPMRAIISRVPRPILALPGASSELQTALLAYDGSPKSKEALFIAAYLAEQWHTRLTVFTASDAPGPLQEYARSYLELHEIQAEFVAGKSAERDLLPLAQERGVDLLLMGGYGGSAWKELVSESLVNVMLRQDTLPLLICR